MSQVATLAFGSAGSRAGGLEPLGGGGPGGPGRRGADAGAWGEWAGEAWRDGRDFEESPIGVLLLALHAMVRLVALPEEERPAAVVPTGQRSGSVQSVRSEEREAELVQERALCERAREGDRRALAQLLRRHGPVLFRSVLLPRLGSEAAAQDALSDTYVRVVERFGQFEWRGCGVYPWLRVIALHIAMDALRARRRETLFDPQDLGREIEQAERQAELGVDEKLCEARDREVARAKLEGALATINQRYAKAIRLRIVEERTREQVAEALGVSVPTFDVVLHRALAALRKAIAATEEAA